MPTRSVRLTEHFDRFIEARVTSGRFGNASEVVREGLPLLEQREQEDRAKLEWLRSSTKEAADSIAVGEGMEFESMDDLAAYVHKVGEEVTEEISVGLGIGQESQPGENCIFSMQAFHDIEEEPERPGSQH